MVPLELEHGWLTVYIIVLWYNYFYMPKYRCRISCLSKNNLFFSNEVSLMQAICVQVKSAWWWLKWNVGLWVWAFSRWQFFSANQNIRLASLWRFNSVNHLDSHAIRQTLLWISRRQYIFTKAINLDDHARLMLRPKYAFMARVGKCMQWFNADIAICPCLNNWFAVSVSYINI